MMAIVWDSIEGQGFVKSVNCFTGFIFSLQLFKHDSVEEQSDCHNNKKYQASKPRVAIKNLKTCMSLWDAILLAFCLNQITYLTKRIH